MSSKKSFKRKYTIISDCTQSSDDIWLILLLFFRRLHFFRILQKANQTFFLNSRRWAQQLQQQQQ